MPSSGSLERLAGSFVSQLPRRQPAQLVVDQWEELIHRLEITLIDRGEKVRHVAHG
jgi:hypothetical protein